MTDEQFAALLERLDRLERAVGLMRLAPSRMPLEIDYGPALQDPRLPTFRDLNPGLPDPAYSPGLPDPAYAPYGAAATDVRGQDAYTRWVARLAAQHNHTSATSAVLHDPVSLSARTP